MDASYALSDTLEFLRGLKENNNREWFEARRDVYERTRAGFKRLVGDLIKGVATFEPSVDLVKPRDALFRLHRDLRFAKDQRPYKTNYGAHISPEGRKSPWGGYYIHIEPGNAFLAGGMYKPEAHTLHRIREEIDYNGDELRAILSAPSFSQFFEGLVGEQLKTAPKSYSKDHPDIDLLRFKSYIVMHPVSDDMVLSGDFVDYTLKVFRHIKPLNTFLNKAIEDVESDVV